MKHAKRAAKFIAYAFLFAQSMAFVAFMYEEALQTTGFAVRAAIQAGDAPTAFAAIERYEEIMKGAQKFQRSVGWVAIWSHQAYTMYFGVAAPSQLSGFIASGVAAEVWRPDARRWKVVDSPNGVYFVDTWKMDPIERMVLNGFDRDALLGKEEGDYLDE